MPAGQFPTSPARAMRRKITGEIITALSLGVFFAGCAHDEHRDEPIVKYLEIQGTKAVSAGDIKSKILTEETSWLAWLPFFQKHYFDLNIWRSDLHRIERFYRAKGFYQARVLQDDIRPDGKNGVGLRVDLDEGAPTLISEIQLKGLDGLPRSERRDLERE